MAEKKGFIDRVVSFTGFISILITISGVCIASYVNLATGKAFRSEIKEFKRENTEQHNTINLKIESQNKEITKALNEIKLNQKESTMNIRFMKEIMEKGSK